MTKFRPCIDIRNGKVTQVIGSTLQYHNNNSCNHTEITNFVSVNSADYYADLYAAHHLTGGHIIMLGQSGLNQQQALLALHKQPNTLQIGGGINIDNAEYYLQHGATHIILTSYIFHSGIIDYNRLNELVQLVGRNKIVLDLSCRKNPIDNQYYVVTDLWTKYTTVAVNKQLIHELSQYCIEYLIHAVDVEGKQCGIETELIELLSQSQSPIPITYAGGIRNLADIHLIESSSHNTIDITIGSALDIFGGALKFDDVIQYFNSK